MAKPVADKLKLRIPAVIFNGSAVYDFNKEEFLWQCEVTQKARDYIKLVMDKFLKNFNDDDRFALEMSEIDDLDIDLNDTVDEPVDMTEGN